MGETRWPLYVISKGRADLCLTGRLLVKERVPFKLVVEEPEADAYRQEFGEAVTVLPFVDRGAIPARNWCWEHSIEAGAERHWCWDDNIRSIQRWHQGRRIPMDVTVALTSMESFVDRYTNVGVAGPNYVMFGTGTQPPFWLNVHVYSCMLIDNALAHRWRGEYNADTDLCLQVLSGGLCTVLFNAFLIEKVTTMKMRGGNTDRYQGDGRLAMARALERQWPGIVTTDRRYGRPQHNVKGRWKGFDTPLIRRPDVDFDALAEERVPLSTTRVREPAKLRNFKTDTDRKRERGSGR